ncbi:MAG: amidase [Pseudomonadota bacterium]
MKRRTLLALPALPAISALAMTTPPAAARAKFAHLDDGVAQIQRKLAGGRLTSRALVLDYLSRLDAHDRHGPRLHSIIATNPEAVAIAADLDRERKAGRVRGPLHGVPVLVKDNLATADKMPTTAGSLALERAIAARDSAVVARLRAAGAIVLGKTNLSEWANIRSPRSTSGWSAVGGLTRNPHALDRNPSGSSSGTAAAIAANFATVGIGTETDGSITSPAAACGLVGLKPTVGLVSRDGIIPISHTQDTAGPITRTVADCAAVLAAIAGADPRDEATAAAQARDYVAALDADALRGARLGVVRSFNVGEPRTQALFEAALDVLRARGAVFVDDLRLPPAETAFEAALIVLLTELKVGLARYLGEFAPGAAVQSLADVIAFNRRHAARAMPYFGQEFFEQAEATDGLQGATYRNALATARRLMRDEGLDVLLREHGVEALVAPTQGPAWLTDLVHGDRPVPSFTTPAAVAGYPHLTVPRGAVAGLPVGLSLVGPAFSEARLLALGYAYEQASRQRPVPALARSALDAPDRGSHGRIAR